jgi:hypothetical protein
MLLRELAPGAHTRPLLAPAGPFLKTPSQGASTTVHAATAGARLLLLLLLLLLPLLLLLLPPSLAQLLARKMPVPPRNPAPATFLPAPPC